MTIYAVLDCLLKTISPAKVAGDTGDSAVSQCNIQENTPSNIGVFDSLQHDSLGSESIKIYIALLQWT